MMPMVRPAFQVGRSRAADLTVAGSCLVAEAPKTGAGGGGTEGLGSCAALSFA